MTAETFEWLSPTSFGKNRSLGFYEACEPTRPRRDPGVTADQRSAESYPFGNRMVPPA